MKKDDFDLLTELATLVCDLTRFVAQAITAEQQGQDYPHRPGDEARLGQRVAATGQRLQARSTDAAVDVPVETIELVRALRAINVHTERVAAALFEGTMPPQKQHEFAGLVTSVSELLHEHADAQTPPPDASRRAGLERDLRRKTECDPSP